MTGIHNDITSAFGNTPLVRLNRVAEGVDGTVLAKLEFYNPASSVKDRLGIAIGRPSRSSKTQKNPASSNRAARSSRRPAATPESRWPW